VVEGFHFERDLRPVDKADPQDIHATVPVKSISTEEHPDAAAESSQWIPRTRVKIRNIPST
jgi:hypothetical protein